MELLDELIGILKAIEARTPGWESKPKELEDKFSSGHFNPLADEICYVVDELVYDLQYYVADPEWRKEDESYIGDDELRQLVTKALAKLRELGVDIAE